MRDSWHEMLENRILRSIPLLVSVVWLMISFIPLKSEISANARPMIGLVCVYFWVIYRPDLFNLWSVFVLGVISDVLSIAPLGIFLFMYLVMYLTVTNLIKYINDKTFEIMWSGLIILLPVVMLSGWLLMSIYYAQFIPIKGLFFSYLLSIALYPLISGVNAMIVNRFLQDDD